MTEQDIPQEEQSASLADSVGSVWAWAIIAGTGTFGFFLHLVVFLATVVWDKRWHYTSQTYRAIGATGGRLNPYWDFQIDGTPPPLPEKTVIVCNHESQADPFIISQLPYEAKWLGKKSLFKIPFVGWSMWLSGDIPVDRKSRTSAKDAMTKCKEWLDRGSNVVIFPEGTRSKTADLLPFKDGAFRLAIENEAHVLPVVVAGTRAALPKHSWRFGKSKALVRVGEPISTEGMNMEDLESLKALAREQMLAIRGELRDKLDITE